MSSYSSVHRNRRGNPTSNTRYQPNFHDQSELDAATAAEQRFQVTEERDEMDDSMGFARYNGPGVLGWMVNMQPTLVRDEEWQSGRSAVDYYFINDHGNTFKSTIAFSPYFYLMCKPGYESDVENYLKRLHESTIESISVAKFENLDMPNHLLGLKTTVLKLCFRNIQDLLRVRKDILNIVRANHKNRDSLDVIAYDNRMNVQIGSLENNGTGHVVNNSSSSHKLSNTNSRNLDPSSFILDIREYDVPYYLRVAMDLDLRVGIWYWVVSNNGVTEITPQLDKIVPPDPVILAYDIETTKLPLKFPDASHDQVMMISYVIDGQGYLITNREIVSEDIDDFEYTPKPEFEGPFTVFNEENECALIHRFFDHIKEIRPHVIVTYNGDFFDWPFMETRATIHGINMKQAIGWFKDENDEYKSYYAHHSDAFKWVKRDSYLPAGSHGLKAVTTAKLGYNPIELDPELMLPYAREKPQILAQYSVSDAVATYYLYMKYVHPFVFSLCNIIPMNPDEVLRKGSGTLCESLLMVKAFKAGVLMPNKHVDPPSKFHCGHLLTSESYVGGHVEALEAGVFRSDIATKFKIDPDTVTRLMDEVDRALQFTLEVEHKLEMEDVVNYTEVQSAILTALNNLRMNPDRTEPPLIYHLDVAAMYPNIILTNRLQPDAMVNEATCASCDYNDPHNQCQRDLEWQWRGEYYPMDMSDYHTLIRGLKESEADWGMMPKVKQDVLLHKRFSEYSRSVYKKIHENQVLVKTSTVCQRENPFYINTVRQFRDRRYEYKGLLKEWKIKYEKSLESGDTAGIAEGKKMIVVMDSLQLAHKCILNSFYGYVMRKGSRWYSMEMGGIVCHTGAKIIQLARELIECVGRPLELDTDGIWCILPKSFPENFKIQTASGKKIVISYPCTMLNHLVHDTFTNHQYQTRDSVEPNKWVTQSENSIFFEIDGPYKAMILPASTEEDKFLKKRYAVFNGDGSLAELKGFEIKRRGELKLIKIFQHQIFSVFLKGASLEECYACVAAVANEWLDVMEQKGSTVANAELIDLISENKNMSKSLSEYEGQKSTAITTAKRLAEFLGSEMVRDKLACHFLVCRLPVGAPVAERALPVALLQADPAIKRHYLRKWCKDNTLDDPDVRELIDWDYYKERFGSVLQKLITIPAAMQGISNPIPRVKHPDWLRTRVSNQKHQSKLTDLFDMEDMRNAGRGSVMLSVRNNGAPGPPKIAKVTRIKSRRQTTAEEMAVLGTKLRESTCPNPLNQYQAWLAHQKLKWRYARLRHEVARQTSSHVPNHGTESAPRTTGLNNMNPFDLFFHQQRECLESTIWQVLQVQEPILPGRPHLIWVLVGNKIHQIPLQVPRTFYINSDIPLTTDQFQGTMTMESVKRVLPRGAPAKHLYQCTVDEEQYVANERTFAQYLSHPSVQGVYESQVPGTFRTIVQLGAQWTLNRAHRRAAGASLSATSKVDWNDLRMATSNVPVPYLGVNIPLDDLLIYHLSSRDRHMIVVYLFRETQDCYIFVTDQSNLMSVGSVNTVYSEFRASHLNLNLPQVTFHTTVFRKESPMLAAFNKCLTTLNQKRTTPMICYIQSSRPFALAYVKALTLFPTVVRPASSRDVSELPALGWQAKAIQLWLHNLSSFHAWKDQAVELAQFSQVPIGNLGNDGMQFSLDVMMARKLIKADHALWYSSDLRPDLGGRQDDEHYSILNAHQPFPEVNSPGYYPGVTIELDVYGLCVSTIKDPAVARCEPGLAPLVSLINFLGLRVQSTLSMEPILGHIYRWLTTPSSLLYDPHATFVVFTQMKRAFMALISELAKLNVTVVYASFSRLIIQTPKTSIYQAQAFIKYVLSHLLAMPQFTVVSLTPVMAWYPLTWMDPYNYAGEQVQNLDMFEPAEISDTSMDVNNSKEAALVPVMRWNIADYLPEIMAEGFQSLLVYYFDQMHQFRLSNINGLDATCQTALPSNGLPESMIHEDEIKFKRQLIRNEMTQRMFGLLPKYIRAEHGTDGVQFPDIPGALTMLAIENSEQKRRSPTLELVKAVVTVLGLDKTVEDAVRIMRRNSLDLIKVREFAPEAQFSNPCLSVIVPQVMCTACQCTRDIDLTREVVHNESGWRCLQCQHLYSVVQLESKLVELIENSILAHQVQDLVCTKCRLVLRENLSTYCPCSGSLTLAVPVGVFRTKLMVIRRLAESHRMDLLNDMIDFTLSVL